MTYILTYMYIGRIRCRFLTILARENGIGNTNLWSRFKHIKPEDLTLSYVVNKVGLFHSAKSVCEVWALAAHEDG